jgi:hypothetical protein
MPSSKLLWQIVVLKGENRIWNNRTLMSRVTNPIFLSSEKEVSKWLLK